KPAVSPPPRVAFDTRAPAVAGRHRIARGDLAERGRPPDLPPDGGAFAIGPHAELRCRGRAGRGTRRGDQGPAGRARPGRVVPAGRRGVPRPHAPSPLNRRARSGRSWIRTRDLRLIRAAL